VAIAAACWFAWGSDEFCLDDAYIHLAYAKSLRLGEGFSYNPFDWELGSTSPLWAWLLVPLVDKAHTLWLVKALGIGLHGLTAWLSCGLMARLVRSPRPDHALVLGCLCTGLLTALHPLLLQAASSGMEVPLATCLLAGTSLLVLDSKLVRAAALAVLAVWTRPESLLFVGVLSTCLALGRRQPKLGLVGGAALAAMVAWCAVCFGLHGQLLPNTFYAKASDTQLLAGFAYLFERVLTEEAWLLGVGGLVLLVPELARGPAKLVTRSLFAAWALTLLAVAASRRLDPRVLFYMQRYFAIVAFAPAALVGAAVAHRGRSALTWCVPVALALVFMVPRARALTRLQEHNIRSLHTEVAHWVGAHAPAGSRVLVEGAGALRYYTPRNLHIVDLLGLNAQPIIQAKRAGFTPYACALTSPVPELMVVPSELLRSMAGLFEATQLASFDEPNYAQTLEPWHRKVFVFRVVGVKPELRARCGNP
jgi:hypothetical protein